MRQLRAFAAVAQHRSVRKAADSLHLTQPAVTRAVRGLERELGLTLFDRSSRGMSTTDEGDLVQLRVRRAIEHLEGAGREMDEAAAAGEPRARRCSLVGQVARRHLQAVIAIADHYTETAAALSLGLSQPSITLALRDLERIVGRDLFLRTSRGMVATTCGQIMVRCGKLALAEIGAIGSDLAASVGLVSGRLLVGALPLSGTVLAPRAISQLAAAHPELHVSVIESPYDALLQGLRCGDIDVMVGTLHPSPPNDMVQERLFDDVLSVVVRPGHPLAQRKRLALPDIANAEWVVPYRRTRSRNVFERAILAAGLSLPAHAIESNTVAMVRGLLRASDRLSVLSRRQALHEQRNGQLTLLPIELAGTELQIGVVMRADAIRSAGLEALLAELRALCEEESIGDLQTAATL